MSETAAEGVRPVSQTIHRPRLYLALLAVAAAVILLSLNALPLSDPDEVFYAQTAREMQAQRSPLTPLLFGHPQFEKPPLTYWLLEGSFAVFGLKPFAGRLIPAIFGILGAWLAYLFGRRVLPRDLAALGALIMLSGLLYFGQSIALLTDMVFTTFVAAAAYAFFLWWAEGRSGFLWAFGALLGLAVLTKGPVAVVVLGLATVAFLLLSGSRDKLVPFLLHPWWLAFAAVAVPWYAWAWVVHGRAFWWEFLVHDNWHRILRAEHRNFDTWHFYPSVIVAGMLPWSPLLVLLGANWKRHKLLQLYLVCWIVATYLVFAVCHSKLASYILPLFPALSVWLAVSLEAPDEHPRRRVAAAVLLGALGIAMAAVPFVVKPDVMGLFPVGIWAVAGCGVALLLASGLLAWRRLAGAVTALAGGFLGLMLLLMTTLPTSAVAGFTDAGVPDLVARYELDKQPIVAAKPYARGVHFFTGNPVVVLDERKQPFWSDHPVEVISTDEEIRAFFSARQKALCVVYPDDAERLKTALGAGYTTEVLSSAFDRTVVLVRRAP